MKKIIILIIIFFITGCDYIELNDLSIIKTIGIDYKDNEYILYAEIISELKKDDLPQTEIIEVNNRNIKKCFQNLITRSNKTIHYSHIDLLILSDTLKEEHLTEIFNYFLNNKDFRNDFMTISSNDINILINNSKYNEIEQLIENNQHKELLNIDIEDVIKDFLDTKTITLSLIEYQKNDVLYKYNVIYQNDNIERINYEK